VNIAYQQPIRSIWLPACALVLGVTTLRAEPISYDESVDGELPDSSTELPAFNFEVGINTISGSGYFSADDREFQDWDVDSFKFNIAPSQRVTSITFSFAVTREENAFWSLSPLSHIAVESVSVYLGDDVALTSSPVGSVSAYLGEDGALISSPVEAPSSPADLYSDILPLSEGQYEFHSSGYTLGWICNPVGELSDLPQCPQDITESAYVAYDYALTFEVQGVTE
jgi:hypothetical protein